MTLRERLLEWTDVDVAGYYLAISLGIFPEPPESPNLDFWNGHKGVFWSANPLGENLHEQLIKLAEVGVLEKNEDQFRWNQNFQISGS